MKTPLATENFRPRLWMFLLVTACALAVSLSGSVQAQDADLNASPGSEAGSMNAGLGLGPLDLGLGSGNALSAGTLGDLKELGSIGLGQEIKRMGNVDPNTTYILPRGPAVLWQLLNNVNPSSDGQQAIMGPLLRNTPRLNEKLEKALKTKTPEDVSAAVEAVNDAFEKNRGKIVQAVNERVEKIATAVRDKVRNGNLSEQQILELQQEAQALALFGDVPECAKSVGKLRRMAAAASVSQNALRLIAGTKPGIGSVEGNKEAVAEATGNRALATAGLREDNPVADAAAKKAEETAKTVPDANAKAEADGREEISFGDLAQLAELNSEYQRAVIGLKLDSVGKEEGSTKAKFPADPIPESRGRNFEVRDGILRVESQPLPANFSVSGNVIVDFYLEKDGQRVLLFKKIYSEEEANNLIGS